MQRIAFIDVDRTLINEEYRLTDPQLRDVIAQKQSEGWQIGLNSDSPLRTLNYWAQHLGLNGPIISERGAEVLFPEDDARIVFTRSGAAIRELRRHLIAKCLDLPETEFVCGDALAFIRSVKVLPYTLASTLIAYNGLRRYSILFFVRKIAPQSGDLLLDTALLREVVRNIDADLAASELVAEGRSDPDYSVFSRSPSDVTKGSAVLQVSRECHVDRMVMIGDSMSDFVDDPSVELYAVGNASHDFQKACSYVAPSRYSQGVREILLRL
jgi:hydroxymethylpyrimidine pyrophosphatase-like HAD family hydrolase